MRLLTALVVLLCLPALALGADCKTALKTIFRNEGGYQCDYNDSGNWTGGKIGKGKLKGTKYGIAASSYPKVDIKALTLEQAARYYERDYWDPLRLDEIKSQWLATMFLDSAVNCGTGVAAILIARTINVLNGKSEDFPVDPLMTGQKIAWINNYTQTRIIYGKKDQTQRALFGSVFREMRARRYVAIVRHDRVKLRYLPVWLERVYE